MRLPAHQMVCCCLAVSNETGRRETRSAPLSKGRGNRTDLALASLTFILGLARSSLSRWLCSRRRRSLSSDIDCLCGRFIVVDVVGRKDGLSVEVQGCGLWERVSCHLPVQRVC